MRSLNSLLLEFLSRYHVTNITSLQVQVNSTNPLFPNWKKALLLKASFHKVYSGQPVHAFQEMSSAMEYSSKYTVGNQSVETYIRQFDFANDFFNMNGCRHPHLMKKYICPWQGFKTTGSQ